jgi:hypothetical protein
MTGIIQKLSNVLVNQDRNKYEYDFRNQKNADEMLFLFDKCIQLDYGFIQEHLL